MTDDEKPEDWLERLAATGREDRLKRSSTAEAKLLSNAWGGNKQAIREAIYLAWFSMRHGSGQLSPAMQDWFWSTIGPLVRAINGEDRNGGLEDALGRLGYEKRHRGHPSTVSDGELELRLEIVAAVNAIATRSTSKNEAVALVAGAVQKSESTIWGYCGQFANVRGLSGELAQGKAKPILTAANVIAQANPLAYSKELRDFLAVTSST